MTTVEIHDKLSQLKPVLQKNFFVTKLGYFGSYLRGEQKQNSDLDILVSFSKPIGWAYFDLIDFIESKLNIRIDLITEKGLRKGMKESILSSVKYV